jgi:hypothetical protein
MATYAGATAEHYETPPDSSYEPTVVGTLERPTSFSITCGEDERSECSATELIQALVEQNINTKAIQCVQKVGKREFLVTFRKDAPLNTVPTDVTVCGNNFVIQKAGPFEVVKYFRHRHIKIFNLPAEMSDREVAVLFGKY